MLKHLIEATDHLPVLFGTAYFYLKLGGISQRKVPVAGGTMYGSVGIIGIANRTNHIGLKSIFWNTIGEQVLDALESVKCLMPQADSLLLISEGA